MSGFLKLINNTIDNLIINNIDYSTLNLTFKSDKKAIRREIANLLIVKKCSIGHFFLLHFVLLSYFEHLPWLYSPHKTIHIKPFCSPVRLSPAIGVMSGAHYQSSIQELLHLVVTFAQCSPYSRVRQLTRTELAWQVKSDQCLRSPHSLTKFVGPP